MKAYKRKDGTYVTAHDRRVGTGGPAAEANTDAASSDAAAANDQPASHQAPQQSSPSTPSSSGPRRRRRRKPLPQAPLPVVPAGGSILQDTAALQWLANETERHTAGYGPGLDIHRTMQNYHGIRMLSKLTRPHALPHGVRAVFGGGTCLALGHYLVERYSEDIDVVLVGGNGLSQEERDEALDAVVNVLSSGSDVQAKPARRGPLYVNPEVPYLPTVEPAGAGAGSDADTDSGLFVKVDAGFADDLPPNDITTVDVHTYLSLRGDLRFASHYGDLSVVGVEAVKPHITLAEKLIALHQRAVMGNRRALTLRARDVFDIGTLLADPDTVDSLQETGSTPADIDARQAVRAQALPQHGRTARRHIRRPHKGFAASPIWQNGHPMNEALRRGYRSTMPALVYDRRKILSYDEVTERVRAHRHLL